MKVQEAHIRQVEVAGTGRRPVSRWRVAWSYTLLVLLALVFLIPFYFVINASLKTDAAVQAGDYITPAIPATPPGEKVSPDAIAPSARTGIERAAANLHGTIQGIYAQGQANSRTYAAVIRSGLSWTQVRSNSNGEILQTESIGPSLPNYRKALGPDHLDFKPALANTVFVTTLCIFGQVLSCSLVGYGFARFRFRGRNILFMVMLSTLMLPAQVTMIPVFVLFRAMGMIDSFWPLILPAWLASPFFVFMFRQFFAQIPEELVEAARIDGASHWRVYWQLMLPLSGPVVAIVAIYTFLSAWNDFMTPLIYLNSPHNRTLALALASFKGQFGLSDAHLLMAAAIVCMLPCVLLFFAAQRYFVESIAMTGLKA